ncbi:hypothetical protein SK3146_04702 [Paenibacillus konkukensis]|uniref:Uncharacterized protein n=1 Tax=Paenibacillus konkukensis TaxID=2020716 RepID=A0ABY4RTG7_9BACL|nr:hypothetical protein SK3146_04702 [Paenibacillus konkukensis]
MEIAQFSRIERSLHGEDGQQIRNVRVKRDIAVEQMMPVIRKLNHLRYDRNNEQEHQSFSSGMPSVR